MRLDDLDPSKNVRDQGRGGGSRSGSGGSLSLLFTILPFLLRGKMGLGTLLILGIAAYFLYSGGGLNLGDTNYITDTENRQSVAGNIPCDTSDELFACRVLKSTEDTWGRLIRNYQPPSLSFYSQNGQSGCGAAQSAMGPFYCPSDQGIYLDTEFFQQMERQMGAGGDFAWAYVIAHEVGHHIQNLDGTAAQVRRTQNRTTQIEGNRMQVAMELQADCYAGVWAAQNADRIEPGDIEEGMAAANAIGDDILMRKAGRTPVESMFTHGTSQQRMAWLRRGLKTGNPASCNIFES